MLRSFLRNALPLLLAALVPVMLAAAAVRHLFPSLHPTILGMAEHLLGWLVLLGIVLAVWGFVAQGRARSALAIAAVPLGAAVFLFMMLLLGPKAAPLFDESGNFDGNFAERLGSSALISIPLFILSGEMAVASGIARRLLRVAGALCARGRRAAEARTLLASLLFATVSGVGPGAVAAGGRRVIPALVRSGRNPAAAAGAVACAGGLALIIPASPPLTIYAAAAGIQTNIVFTASFVPGLVVAGALYAALLLTAPRPTAAVARATAPASRRAPARRLAVILRGSAPALLMPAAVLPALFTGFLTAPEAAAAGAAYAFAVGRLARRRLSWGSVWVALARSAATAAVIIFMADVGSLFAWLMDAGGFTDAASDAVLGLTGAAGGVVILNLILLAAGCILDMPAIVTLLVPLLLPLALRCGLSPAHFGVVVVMNLAVGLVTPPAAKNLAAAAALAGVGMREAAAGARPFILAMLACLAAVAAWPGLCLWLPGAFGWPV